MAIVFHKESRCFHLYNNEVSYIIRIMENEQLEQLYYGKRIHDREDFTYFHEECMRSQMSINVPEPGILSMQYTKQPPSDLAVSLGGLFFAFPQQIFFVAVHLVLFFFGQALALFAGFVRGVDVGQAQKVVGGGAVELANGNQHLMVWRTLFMLPTADGGGCNIKGFGEFSLCLVIPISQVS